MKCVSNPGKEPLLAELEVLVVDCQATSSNPGKGHLLEIGWVRARASNGEYNEKITSYLIKLPQEETIPTAVKRVTGISTQDVADALPPKKAWKKLSREAKKTAAANKRKLCPTVIHFARFEEAYLRDMQRKWSPKEFFPFEIICTHKIIKRLLPQLPRKGLRAAAGYLGFSVPELRRSASHIEATIFTWKETVKRLEQQGIRTLEELREWLEAPPAAESAGPGSPARVYPMSAKERRGLPGLPGIYRMLRSNGDLLYIGKAKSLKQRVGSYFRKSARHGERTLEMLTQAYKLDITVTGSALEAALLESDEIKKHSPPYNVALREKERQLFYFSSDLRQVGLEADEVFCFGPVVSLQTLQSLGGIIELLEKVFEKGTGEEINKSFGSPEPFFKRVLAAGGKEENNLCVELLGIPEEYAPGLEIFLQGFELFCQEHIGFLKRKGIDKKNPLPPAAPRAWGGVKPLRGRSLPGAKLLKKFDQNFCLERKGIGKETNIVNRVLRLGKELRRRKLEELAAAALEEAGACPQPINGDAEAAEVDLPEGEPAQAEPADEPGEKVWTPEAAASMSAGIIRHGAHLLRRSRWFSLLSESSLYWQEIIGKEKKGVLLCFQGGQISRREDFAAEEEIELPVPPGYGKSAVERRRGFDLAAYDRMRVVTTELRRIISEDKDGVVKLRLGPKALLGKKELSELLQWV